ncbi:HRDC domain-containing protein, partial [Streptomyces sp. TRM76130]|nr:HRDC domain-containing protein [Streptomyces sp. TRM76130]
PQSLVPAFEALRAWRAERAREQGVPAYVIFHDATLREIATVWPTSIGQLGGIGGVGEKKLTTYGEGVLEVLAGLDGPAAGGAEPSSASSPAAAPAVPSSAPSSAPPSAAPALD